MKDLETILKAFRICNISSDTSDNCGVCAYINPVGGMCVHNLNKDVYESLKELKTLKEENEELNKRIRELETE